MNFYRTLMIQMIKFSLLGETILEWNDKDIVSQGREAVILDFSEKSVDIAIRGRLTWGTILITDKHRSYASFAEQNNIHLYQSLGKEHVHRSDPSPECATYEQPA